MFHSLVGDRSRRSATKTCRASSSRPRLNCAMSEHHWSVLVSHGSMQLCVGVAVPFLAASSFALAVPVLFSVFGACCLVMFWILSDLLDRTSVFFVLYDSCFGCTSVLAMSKPNTPSKPLGRLPRQAIRGMPPSRDPVPPGLFDVHDPNWSFSGVVVSPAKVPGTGQRVIDKRELGQLMGSFSEHDTTKEQQQLRPQSSASTTEPPLHKEANSAEVKKTPYEPPSTPGARGPPKPSAKEETTPRAPPSTPSTGVTARPVAKDYGTPRALPSTPTAGVPPTGKPLVKQIRTPRAPPSTPTEGVYPTAMPAVNPDFSPRAPPTTPSSDAAPKLILSSPSHVRRPDFSQPGFDLGVTSSNPAFIPEPVDPETAETVAPDARPEAAADSCSLQPNVEKTTDILDPRQELAQTNSDGSLYSAGSGTSDCVSRSGRQKVDTTEPRTMSEPATPKAALHDSAPAPGPERDVDYDQRLDAERMVMLVQSPSKSDRFSTRVADDSAGDLAEVVNHPSEESGNEELTFPNVLLGLRKVKPVQGQSGAGECCRQSSSGTQNADTLCIASPDTALQNLVVETCVAKLMDPAPGDTSQIQVDASWQSRRPDSASFERSPSLDGVVELGLSVATEWMEEQLKVCSVVDPSQSGTEIKSDKKAAADTLPPLPQMPASAPVQASVLKKLATLGATGKIVTVGIANSSLTVVDSGATDAVVREEKKVTWDLPTPVEACSSGAETPLHPDMVDPAVAFEKDPRRKMLYEVWTRFHGFSHEQAMKLLNSIENGRTPFKVRETMKRGITEAEAKDPS